MIDSTNGTGNGTGRIAHGVTPAAGPWLREPPYNQDAEEAVLGACLMERRAIAAARAMLTPDAFYRSAHRTLFEAIGSVFDREETVDPLTLVAELDRTGQLEHVGGRAGIGYLVDAVPTAANVTYHARLVREAAQRRETIEILGEALARAWDADSDLTELAIEIQNRILPIAVDSEAQGYRSMRDVLYHVLEEIEERGKRTRSGQVADLATGFPEIDRITNGFRDGELIVFGGGPKSGKTALTLAIALYNVLHGAGAAFVSAEMMAAQLAERCLNAMALVHTHATARGDLSQHDWERLTKAAGELARHPAFFVDDEAFPSLGDVIARATALKSEHPEIPLVVVDYLQLVSYRLKGRRGDEEIAEVCRGLKGLAKRLGVPVFAPCQTNYKEVDKRKQKKPQLHDLQGGSAMAQTSDFVGLVYRPGQHDSAPGRASTIEVEFAASRRTEVFTAVLEWAGQYMLVSSPSHRYESETEEES